MNENNKISRRNFLISILAASGLSFFAGSYWYLTKMEEAIKILSNPIQDQDLKDLFNTIEDSMSLIGKEYLSKMQNDVTKPDILSKINGDFLMQDITPKMFFDLKEWVKQQIVRDFKNENFVYIGNWMITNTEARLCAFIYLSE